MNDTVENAFIKLMWKYDISFDRPERIGGRIYFYLPLFDMYVEVKAHSCERLHDQLESVSGRPVMVLIGVQSVRALDEMLAHLVPPVRPKEK